MCDRGDRTMTPVHVNASIANEGVDVYKPMPIDTCIADMIKRLDDAGLRMLASCCGHGESETQISLIDGRVIYIARPRCRKCGEEFDRGSGREVRGFGPRFWHTECPTVTYESEETP